MALVTNNSSYFVYFPFAFSNHFLLFLFLFTTPSSSLRTGDFICAGAPSTAGAHDISECSLEQRKDSPSVSQDEDGIGLTLSLLDGVPTTSPGIKPANEQSLEVTAAIKSQGPISGQDVEAAVVTSDLNSVISL
jgi:hypothetical protein